MRTALLVAALAQGCSSWAIAADTSIAADVASTAYMSNGCDWQSTRIREANPLLGPTPTTTALLSSMVVEWALVGVADVALPKSWRSWVLGVLTVGETGIATHNVWLANQPEARVQP